MLISPEGTRADLRCEAGIPDAKAEKVKDHTAVLDCPTACGLVRLQGTAEKLRRVLLLAASDAPAEGNRAGSLARWEQMLQAYFAGHPIHVNPRALLLEGLRTFQRRLYESLMEVPFGDTVSYGELAAMCGHPGAARAVGQALSKNPLPLFVPCHRVVRADGGAGGFTAGAGWKQCLLSHEGWRVENGRLTGKTTSRATENQR